MRNILLLVISLSVLVSTVAAQNSSDSGGSKRDLLSMDQQIKVGEMITQSTRPLPSGGFAIAVGRTVPAEIEVHPLPAEAERLAPQLRGFGYDVVEEQIALVDQHTRKVELVFPRWAR